MTRFNILFVIVLSFVGVTAAMAQRPPRRPDGPPGVQGPPPGIPQTPRAFDEWLTRLDSNKDGSLDQAELAVAIDHSFRRFDRNGNGTIESVEMGPQQRRDRPPDGTDQFRRGNGPGPVGRPDEMMLPPFFFRDSLRGESNISRSEFENIVRSVFAELDEDGNGVITKAEAAKLPPPPGGGPLAPPPGLRVPPPPNAMFIGAELRFGDKLVTGQPFSAQIVIQNTRRLFDGTTVTKEDTGALYRDSSGRTRREQPVATIGGLGVVGSDDKPQKLVFISDLANSTQIFLDINNQIARTSKIGPPQPAPAADEPDGGKSESLGSKTIEGVKVDGTRITSEIPAGRFGNQAPIRVETERWFSPELQVVVYSRHVDPIAGEHIFKLVNISRSEPDASLFTIPSGYTSQDPKKGRPGRQ